MINAQPVVTSVRTYGTWFFETLAEQVLSILLMAFGFSLVLWSGGSIIPAAFHAGPNFAGYAPVQLTTGPLTPGQFYPQLIYWPYPSPPVSPTNYYARTISAPSALPPQQAQQQMVCICAKWVVDQCLLSMSICQMLPRRIHNVLNNRNNRWSINQNSQSINRNNQYVIDYYKNHWLANRLFFYESILLPSPSCWMSDVIFTRRCQKIVEEKIKL